MSKTFNKKLVSQLKTIFWITVAWTLVSVHQFVVGYLSLYGFAADFNFEVPADPMIYLQQSLIVGVLAGLIGGSGIVFVWERWLRSKPYGKALFGIFLSYSVIYFMVAVPTELFFRMNVMNSSILDFGVWKATVLSVFESDAIFGFITWLVIVLCTMIVLLVNDKYGPGVFRKFLLGKYFHAQREERVFMFLDLRSSTTIAEEIGEEKYFNFLKDVFEHATPGILKYKGEIYQYVGDEIVISWELDAGIKNSNCIKCYFEIQSILNKKKDFFLDVYGVEPVFKAGLHYGHVMAGEIGVVKREIAFSGDVLNTTARIQSKCNELGVDILASKFLVEKLNLNADQFNPREIGEMELRGKKELVTLFTM